MGVEVIDYPPGVCAASTSTALADAIHDLPRHTMSNALSELSVVSNRALGVFKKCIVTNCHVFVAFLTISRSCP